MTTIIRVKRHRGEDPVEALVLSCKRKKTENSSSDTDSNLFKYVLNFSGTVEEKVNFSFLLYVVKNKLIPDCH